MRSLLALAVALAVSAPALGAEWSTGGSFTGQIFLTDEKCSAGACPKSCEKVGEHFAYVRAPDSRTYYGCWLLRKASGLAVIYWEDGGRTSHPVDAFEQIDARRPLPGMESSR